VPVQPTATYRLQLHPGFGFREALEVLPYLRDLGVSHVYCSPCFQAARGSAHGYDVTDPARISDELGGADAHREFCERVHALELGQVLDIVPNHMCVTDPGNWRWWDVLEKGRESAWSEWFDIDWEASNRILVPILGDRIDRILERGELRLGVREGETVVRYFDAVLPLARGSAPAAGEPRTAPSTSAMRELLDRQHYRLACWRDAAGHINYRRFFDISSLVGVRVEDERVFDDTQRLAIELVRTGMIDGLRVDHVDGLRQPREYLDTLRAGAGERAWLLVEKILAENERIPVEWPVAGTTGYEFAAVAGGLFVDPAGERPLRALMTEMTGERRGTREIIDDCKRLVCEQAFAADIARLARTLVVACDGRVEHRHRGPDECAQAITAVLVGLPVYRTYATGTEGRVSMQDGRALAAALRHARENAQGVEPALLDLIGALIDGGAKSDAELDFALRLQQTGAAVTAKGVEDTSFYRCTALTSICEVGDSPLHWGTTVAAFHAHNASAAARRGSAMLATSTHDTKRSEDVRVRLHVLSEFAGVWADRVRRWASRNARHKVGGDPDAADELMLYQTLAGAHPLDVDRAAAYMEKATREAKRRTSWTDPDPAYDAAVQAFTRAVAGDEAFCTELEEFVVPLVMLGRVNSLALTLLKLTSPGVPDIYQGCELWDLSLVDPDNRRPVDFDRRKSSLAGVVDARPRAGWNDDSGVAKLALITGALALRARRAASFTAGGGYRAIEAIGDRADHVVAVQRGDDVVAVVPRLVGRLSGWSARYQPAWNDTRLRLPEGSWSDILSGREHGGGLQPLSRLLDAFPVALLEREHP
jgi:(1->4)-alpha-D-glucan 1-alpha-D-glucosylmutase